MSVPLFKHILCGLLLLAVPGGCDGGCSATEHERLRNEREALREQVRALEEEKRFLEFQREIHTTDKRYLVLDLQKARGSVRIDGTILREFPLADNDCPRPAGASAEQQANYLLPRGRIEMIAKKKNPVWYRPDWMDEQSEGGAPYSKGSDRLYQGPLGPYAFFFGGGFMIHGRPAGSAPVLFEHACIIFEDDDLRAAYSLLEPGSIAYVR